MCEIIQNCQSFQKLVEPLIVSCARAHTHTQKQTVGISITHAEKTCMDTLKDSGVFSCARFCVSVRERVHMHVYLSAHSVK